MNSVDVLKHVIVPDADDAIADSGQISISLPIRDVLGVLTAVELDD